MVQSENPPVLADSPGPEVEQAPTQSELQSRLEEAEKMGEVGRSLSHHQPTVGPDGCIGWAIYVGWGGTSQEKALTYHWRQDPLEGIPLG